VATLIRCAYDADDATQVALVEILKAAPSYRGESSLEAWADRIAVRVAIGVARERRLASVRNHCAVSPDELRAPLAPPSLSEAIPRPIRRTSTRYPRRDALRRCCAAFLRDHPEGAAASALRLRQRELEGQR
jgi:DNA-directed RNA polymerase specialized sigma24 family protein